MSSYQFVVPGDPVPKARARVTFGRKAHTYTPPRTKAFEELVKIHYKGSRFLGPVSMMITFCRATLRDADLSNLAKGVEDALNEVAYVDDAQIVESVLGKEYTPNDPCVVVLIQDTDDPTGILRKLLPRVRARAIKLGWIDNKARMEAVND